MVSGVPAHVDGPMQHAVQDAGASLINPDRMWHYTEGLRNWNPIWPNHGIRVLPGPSSLWLTPGERLPFPHFPGFDRLGTLSHITQNGYPYTWFRSPGSQDEFALSGSEQNPDLTDRDLRLTLAGWAAACRPRCRRSWTMGLTSWCGRTSPNWSAA